MTKAKLIFPDYSPTNYTPSGGNMDGHLAGVDARLAETSFLDYASVSSFLSSSEESRGAGKVWRAGSYSYVEADSSAEDYHVSNASGVKFYVQLSGSSVYVDAFGADNTGESDTSNEIRKALRLAYSCKEGNRGMPAITFGAGVYLITSPGIFSDFTNTYVSGLMLRGEGTSSTVIKYSVNTGEYALETTYIMQVSLRDFSIEMEGESSRFILHQAGGGGGSIFSHENVFISGTFDQYFTIKGTILGSETFWKNVFSNTSSGSFFVIEENPQSVNHTFIGCTFGSFGGTGGVIFNIQAGGNIRWFGGYSSLCDGSTFLKVQGPGVLIGASNDDYSFYGWHPEVAGGSVGDVRIVEASSGFINFTDCNLTLLKNDNDYVNYLVEKSVYGQSGCYLNFFKSKLSDFIRFSLEGLVRVTFDACSCPADWSDKIALSRYEGGNYYSPEIRVVNSQDPVSLFSLEREVGSGFPQPIAPAQSPSLKTKVLSNAANFGRAHGLTTGFNDEYQYFEGTLPIGSVVKEMILVYIGGHSSAGSGDRTFKVENEDGSLVFIPETVVSNTRTVVSTGQVPLMYSCLDSSSSKIRVYGKVSTPSVAPGIDDYGYLLVEYY
jgi:hypothetical protein